MTEQVSVFLVLAAEVAVPVAVSEEVAKYDLFLAPARSRIPSDLVGESEREEEVSTRRRKRQGLFFFQFLFFFLL